jgi:hypothetical protein
MQFNNIGNASTEMTKISANAIEALQRIGKESTINARRVRKYGVQIDETGQKR